MNKFKNRLKYFMECYFNQTFCFDELDQLIMEFKEIENNLCKELFTQELEYFIQTKKYSSADRILRKYGNLNFNDLEKVKKFINYLHDKLLNKTTTTKAEDFIKQGTIIFCPVCTADPETVMEFGIIDKATVISNNIEIYICKPCKLVWLDENNIQKDNAIGYKEFMKTNGLKGFWNELKDVDIL